MGTPNASIARALGDFALLGGALTGRRRVPGAVELDDDVVQWVSESLSTLPKDGSRQEDRELVHGRLVSAVAESASTEVDHDGHLLAAAHMLAVGPDPRDFSKPAPYNDLEELSRSIGMSVAEFGRVTGASPRAGYESSVTVRRAYAAAASGLGSGDDLRPSNDAQVLAIGQAILEAVERTFGGHEKAAPQPGENEGHAETMEPSPDEQRSSDELPSRPAGNRSRLIALAVSAVIALAVVVGFLLVVRGTVPAAPDGSVGGAVGGGEAAGPQVEVTSLEPEPPDWRLSPTFWVPATAPLEELDELTGGCGNAAVRNWLMEHGSYREAYFFTVRNQEESTVGVTDVRARGESSPAKPGLLINCVEGGGGGGELEWSALRLELVPDGVAVLADGSRASDFFWRDVDAGATAGIAVYPSGSQDFRGTLTVKVSTTAAGGADVAVLDATGTTPYEIVWHATLAEKSVKWFLSREDDQPFCEINGQRIDPCDSDAVREAVDDLWTRN